MVSIAVREALKEISPEEYRGPKPPLESYQEACKGAELYAFRWDSTRFKCAMYLKFCVFDDQLFIHSFHRADEKIDR